MLESPFVQYIALCLVNFPGTTLTKYRTFLSFYRSPILPASVSYYSLQSVSRRGGLLGQLLKQTRVLQLCSPPVKVAQERRGWRGWARVD